MKKLISHAWFRGGVKEFDTQSGKITGSSKKDWGSTGFGSLWKQNGKVFAFYNDDQSLLLQCGTKKWRVNAEYTPHIKVFSILRNFQIFHQGEAVFSIWYVPKGLFFSVIDPTYDALDAETDDFFLYVQSMWVEWANRPYSEFLNQLNSDDQEEN